MLIQEHEVSKSLLWWYLCSDIYDIYAGQFVYAVHFSMFQN